MLLDKSVGLGGEEGRVVQTTSICSVELSELFWGLGLLRLYQWVFVIALISIKGLINVLGIFRCTILLLLVLLLLFKDLSTIVNGLVRHGHLRVNKSSNKPSRSSRDLLHHQMNGILSTGMLLRLLVSLVLSH